VFVSGSLVPLVQIKKGPALVGLPWSVFIGLHICQKNEKSILYKNYVPLTLPDPGLIQCGPGALILVPLHEKVVLLLLLYGPCLGLL